MQTLKGKRIELLHSSHPENLTKLLLSNREKEHDFHLTEILHDPLLLPDIEKAVERIFQAKERGEKVMIFGDYDVDGVSSTAALFLFLRDEIGLQVSYRLPHRVHDGYGIKSYHMDEIAATGTKLVITVDCGTKDIEPIEYAHTLWMDVIVTDHHSCPQILPKCVAVVNPQRADSLYPFRGLSGSGVVWKVIHAILKKVQNTKYKIQNEGVFSQNIEEILRKYVDIVSLGTVADCMPMIDENRTIVRRWILQSQQSHHPFFQTFVDTLKRPILTEEDIGFFVWPMLNAWGRLTTPYQSLSTLLAGTLDSFARIQELIAVNELRKGKSKDAHEKALAQIDLSEPMLIVIDPTLEHGILWLVAGKLTEQFHKPSAVFTLHEGMYVGSLRAPLGVDLVAILNASSPHLARYGGHAGAAGCSIEESKMQEACQTLQLRTGELYHEIVSPFLRIDSVLDPGKITLDTVREIESLRPFWQEFPAPLFLLENIEVPITPLGTSGDHLRWEYSGLDIIWFGMADIVSQIGQKKMHLIGTLKSRTWRDVTTPQFQVMDVI
jgi:single-stranded-DNA-specific exonuclease